MRAAFVKVPFQVEIRDLPIIEPGPNEALVRVRACGICGTDVHIARLVAGDWCGIGHEVAGEVEKVGSLVTKVKPGDKVMLENWTFCGQCENCKNGHVELCSAGTGMDDQVGAAEYITMNERSLQVFDGIPFEHVVLTEPLGVALDVTTLADIPLNSTVCVMGPGPIGLMAVKLAKLNGAKTVILTGLSTSTRRLQVGREMGADEVIHVDKTDVVEWFAERYPQGIDRVIVTSPPITLLPAIKIAKFGGIIAFMGIDFGEGRKVTFDVNEIHFKRLQLRASHAIPNLMFPIGLDMIKRGAIDASKLVTHVYPMEKAEEALRGAASEESVKAVLTC